MNTTKLLLKKCAPVILSLAGCSLLSNCDSATSFNPKGGNPGSNLDEIAKPITDTRLLDYIQLETENGTSAFEFIDFTSNISGALNNNTEEIEAGTGASAEELAARTVVNILFDYATQNENTFALENVTAGIYEQQFVDHVNGIYGSQQFGFNSITREITLNHDINDFDLAEVLAIAEEFNGYTAASGGGGTAESSGDILSVHLPSKTLYSLSSEEYVFTITSTNDDRILGRVRGTFTRRVFGRGIAWRKPTAGEVGDAGSLRLDPNHLVPFISNKILNLGIAETGTFEMFLVAGNNTL